MSSSNTIPGVYSVIEDGNLGIARPPAIGDSVLVIGTAEDGPELQPIPITSTDALTGIFGRFGQGSLVRGVHEVMYSTDTHIDVRAMRIGNGEKATVGIKEASGYVSAGLRQYAADAETGTPGIIASGLADPTITGLDQYIDALTLTAKYSGTRYNNFTMRVGRDDNPNSNNYGKNCVIVYNPFTGSESSFSYDYYYVNNTSVDVHDIEELSDAINADNELNPYVTASTQDLRAQYEVVVAGTNKATSYVVPHPNGTASEYASAPASLKEGAALETEWNSDGSLNRLVLKLPHITTAPDSDSDGKPDPILAPIPEYGESTVVAVGPIGTTWSKNIATAGNQVTELTNIYEIALAKEEHLSTVGVDHATLANYPVNRNTSVVPASTNKTIVKLDGSDKTTSEYRQVVVGGVVGVSTSGTEKVFKFRAFLEPDASGIPDVRPIAADRKFRVYETVDGVTFETKKTVTVDWNNTTKEATLTFDTAPEAGTVISVDYISNDGTLTECATRTELESHRAAHKATDPAYQYYFITGDRIYFAYPHETDIEISYEYKRVYNVPGDVSITSDEVGRIEFTNPAKMPQIDRVGGARIGLQYTYRPEWITIPGVVALGGGSNGVNMSTLQLKDALSKAYGAVENYEVDIIVPMGIHLDDTYDEYSQETGIKRVVNAGFHIQLAEALESIADNTAEVIGIIPVKTAAASTITEINNWATKLTVPNSTDRNRAANYMAVYDAKRVQVVAADVVMSSARLGVNTVDYITTGATLYAGLIASLPSQMPATNKYVGRTILAIRNKLSRRQQEALIGSRYVIFDDRPGLGIVAVKDVTAAAPGSDYDSLSTFRITKMVVDMIRSIGQGYIGAINSEQNRASLRAAINNGLFNLTSGPNQALRKYNLRVTSTLDDQRQGIIWVDVVLFPVFGINAIHVRVRLSNAS